MVIAIFEIFIEILSKKYFSKNMGNYEKLPLYNKFYMLIKLMYKTVHNMPREYKCNIGNEIISIAWNCVDLFFEANSLANKEKSKAIKRLSAEFDKLKFRLRMMHEINLISSGQFTHFQENYIQSIGEQMGSWLRWADNFRI